MSSDVPTTPATLPPSKRNLELSELFKEASKRAKPEDKGKQTSIDSRTLKKNAGGRVFPPAWWEYDGRVEDLTADMDEYGIMEEINEYVANMDEYQLKQVLKMCIYLNDDK